MHPEQVQGVITGTGVDYWMHNEGGIYHEEINTVILDSPTLGSQTTICSRTVVKTSSCQ